MEEILASIRRIISEDEHGLGAPKATDFAPPKPVDFGAAKPAEYGAPRSPELTALPPNLPSVPVSAADIDALFSARVADFAPPLEIRNEAPHVEPAPIPAPVVEPRMLRPAPLPPVSEPVRAPAPAPFAAPPVRSVVDEQPASEPLLSPAADAIVNSAFGNLASTVLAGNSRTLEDLVKDMLRPMLKQWLDTNLPPLVERLVRDEIERVSRGR